MDAKKKELYMRQLKLYAEAAEKKRMNEQEYILAEQLPSSSTEIKNQ